MTRCRWGFLGLVVSGLLSLGAACAPLPQPFEHTRHGIDWPSARLGTLSGVTVDPPLGLSPPLAQEVAAGMAAALRLRNVPAVAGGEAPLRDGGYHLTATLAEGDGPAVLIWSLTAPDGAVVVAAQPGSPVPAAVLSSALTAETIAQARMAGGEQDLAARIAESLEHDLERPLAQRMALALEDGDDPTLPLNRLILGLVTGEGLAPAQVSILRGAVRTALRRQGVTVLEGDAPPPEESLAQVVGTVVVGDSEEQGLAFLSLAWTLQAPDGRIIGTVTQENDVPRSALGERFPALAAMVAQGTAEGVLDALRKLTLQ